MGLKTKSLLCLVEVILSAAETIVPAVDRLGDCSDVVFVGAVVDVSCFPEPRGALERILGLLEEFRVADEVDVECLATLLVVGSAGDLDGSASFEAHAVAGLCVAEVFATFVCRARSELLEPLQTAGLVADLREEVCNTQLSVDVGDLQCIVDVLGIVFEL